MATDPLANVKTQVGLRIAEIRDAIRQLAVANGLATLEGLARCSAQLALLPGHRVAVQSCLEHVETAIDSRSESDCATILAALAVRLH
jgi:hypothetical protein